MPSFPPHRFWSGPFLSSLHHSPQKISPLFLMMKKMEMTAKEEDPSSQLPVYTTPPPPPPAVTTAPHPRQQAHTHCNIDIESESPSQTLLSGRCCLRFPCFGSPRRTTTRLNRIRLGAAPTTPSSSSSSSFWANIRAAENGNTWWARPVRVFKKLREWSEVLAGPKWKTFIRRFNRSGCKGLDHYQGNGSSNSKMFQYDPLSYALNFDEGIRGRNHEDDPLNEEDSGYYPDFTSRYVKVSVTNSSSSSSHNHHKSTGVLDLRDKSSRTAPAV